MELNPLHQLVLDVSGSFKATERSLQNNEARHVYYINQKDGLIHLVIWFYAPFHADSCTELNQMRWSAHSESLFSLSAI